MDPDVGTVPSNPYPQGGMATIDTPQFDKSGTELKLESKSVKSASQAWNICKGLEFQNRQRNLRTASVEGLYNGAPPFSQGANMEKAAGWRANTSTLWLAGIVDRVSQRFVNAIISQTYVTASALPATYNNYKTKSDFLRAKFTELVRSWSGNTLLINNICKENSLQGYCYAVFLDPKTHVPTFFKQDELFVPEKSGQHASELQFFAARRDFRLDKFIELFRDEEAAADNGYDIKNCLEAANKAVMQDVRDDAATTQFRKFEDMIDEGTQGLCTNGSGERVVKCWMLFNREYDGKVSFWLLQRDTGALLRFSFKLFKRMEDVLTMFSFEAGNGCIHSSKGLGRKLASLSIMKELFRCGIIDNSRISGLMVVRCSAADKTKFAPAIVSPFMILDSSVQLGEQQFETSAEAYKTVDTLIDAWAEQAVGAYLAAQITEQGRTERTATEATIDARRENEASDIMIRRCLDQDATRIQMQQLRVCTAENIAEAQRIKSVLESNPEATEEELYPFNTEEAAVLRFLVEVLQFGITEEEILIWSRSQASAFAHVTELAEQRGIEAVFATMGGNVNIDQQRLAYMRLEALVGAEKARQLFVPTADTTMAIEAERKQQEESALMTLTGLPIKVSPRDNHLGEMPTIVEVLKRLQPAMATPNPSEVQQRTIELNLNHFGEHLQAALALGENKNPLFEPLNKFYLAYKSDFEQSVAIASEAQVAQSVVQQSVRGAPAPQPEAAAALSPVNQPGAIQPEGFGAPLPEEEPALA